MIRTDKKTESAIVNALNEVCETLKLKSVGFSWLTHFVDYSDFPQSLKIVFVYDSNQNCEHARNKTQLKTISQLTESSLVKAGVVIKVIDNAMFFDTEENGADVDNRNWCRRYT
jgi:hypothetical protein